MRLHIKVHKIYKWFVQNLYLKLLILIPRCTILHKLLVYAKAGKLEMLEEFKGLSATLWALENSLL